MTLKDILSEKKISLYQFSKETDIPYSTLSDIVNGKKNIDTCTISTIKKIADGLEMSIDELYKTLSDDNQNSSLDMSFDVFKSNVCHRLKEDGQLDFIENILTSNVIDRYWEQEEYAKAFYLLAMVDYLSKRNHIPLYNKYDKYRTKRLVNKIYPSSMVICSVIYNVDIDTLVQNPIKEFLKYNIVEGDIFDVV